MKENLLKILEMLDFFKNESPLKKGVYDHILGYLGVFPYDGFHLRNFPHCQHLLGESLYTFMVCK